MTRLVKRVRGNGHSYYLDGQRLPGVTTVTGLLDKPALPPWAARKVAEFVADATDEELDAYRRLGRQGMVNALKSLPWGARDEARDRGKAAHAVCEDLITGREVDVAEELYEYAVGAKKFMDDWRPRPILTEACVYSEAFGYAGTLDLVADLNNGQRALLDYKTSTDIYPEVAMQLAAYRWAQFYVDYSDNPHDGVDVGMHTLEIDCAYAVRIYPGGYDLVPVDSGPEVFGAFRHLLAVYQADRTDWVGNPMAKPDSKKVAA